MPINETTAPESRAPAENLPVVELAHEIGSCVRADTVRQDFSVEFASWMVAQNFRGDYPCDLLCMGWEL